MENPEWSGLGYDDGDIRGEWADLKRLLAPKIGEIALKDEDTEPPYSYAI